MPTLDEQAIAAALSGKWQEAVTLNQQILESIPSSIDALNRLGYAFAKCGNFKTACEMYHKVLKMDSYNPLALKNLAKYKNLNGIKQKYTPNGVAPITISPSLFLTDAEKTKTVTLVNCAPHSALQMLAIGEEVFPLPRRFELQIKDKSGAYVGRLPDDVGHPLIKATKISKAPCRFFVKDISEKKLTVFIKYA
jgi:tetratricopeptide (TPR) repeat protein